MASSTYETPQIQVKFFTKQKRYAVPDCAYSIPGTASIQELNLLLNTLLSEVDEHETVEFDFLAAGELLRIALQDHLKNKEISWESVVEIEYLTHYPSPTPEQSIVHDDWVSSVSTSAECVLTGCYDNTLQLWTLKGEHKLTIPGHTAPVKAVQWLEIGSAVDTFVSVSHDETAMLWQWNKKRNAVECVHVCKGHSRSVDCVDCSPAQQKFVTGSYDRMLKIWSSDVEQESTEEGEEGSGRRVKKQKTEGTKAKHITPLLTLSGHNEAVTAVQWMETNEVCTSSLDSTIRLWDVDVGGMKSQMNGSKAFLDISYSPLSRHVISASADRHLRLWDPRSKEGSVVKCVFTSHTGWVSCVSWAPHLEHLFISGSYDHLLKMWDIRCPKAPLYDLSGHSDRVLCCDWSVPDHVASGGADSHLKVFRSQGQQSAEELIEEEMA